MLNYANVEEGWRLTQIAVAQKHPVALDTLGYAYELGRNVLQKSKS